MLGIQGHVVGRSEICHRIRIAPHTVNCISVLKEC